jgi:outer membrane protein assembly factor BamB
MRKAKCFFVIFVSLILIQLCGISLASSTSINSSSDEWMMFRHDPGHSGFVTGKNHTNSPRLLWIYKTHRMVHSSPAVAKGYVVVASRDSAVYCLNASNGDQVWMSRIGYEVWSSPAISEGNVYISAGDGYVYSLKMTTGTLVWRTKIAGEQAHYSSPAVVDGIVYIGSGDQNVYALDASNGAVIWSYPTQSPVQSSPAVSDGIVYFAAEDYYLYALNASTGKEIWRTFRGATISSPNVHNGYVYIGSEDGYIFAVNASTGAKIWAYKTKDAVSSSPAVAYGRVFVGSEDNNVYSLNASTGEKLWQTSTGYWVNSSPAVVDDKVYIGSEDYGIYCFDAFTGETEWSYTTGNFVDSSPAIVNGTLYVGSYDSCIYALVLDGLTDVPAPLNSQFANSMAWSTIAFDAIAAAIVVVVILVIIRFVRFTWRNKGKAKVSTVSGKNYSWFSVHTDALCVLAILAFSIIFFVNLGSGSLWISDERRYSQWAFHMIKNGDYLNPWAFGDLSFYLSKPPLNMWLMALSYQVFGINNFASRLSSAVFGVLSLIVVFYLGKKLYNSYVGFLSAIILGTFTTFFLFARHAMTDVPFVSFILASIYFFVLSKRTNNSIRYAALSGLFFGLALMTKQVEALLIPLIICIFLALTERSIRFLITKRFAVFLGIGVLIFLPWLIYMTLSFGSYFWETYFFHSVVTRTVTPIEGHFGDYLYYFTNLIQNENIVWVLLLPFATGTCVINAVFKGSKADTLIVMWISIVLLVFTFAQTKIYWYILPAFPAFAIAIGSLLYPLLKKIYRYSRANWLR